MLLFRGEFIKDSIIQFESNVEKNNFILFYFIILLLVGLVLNSLNKNGLKKLKTNILLKGNVHAMDIQSLLNPDNSSNDKETNKDNQTNKENVKKPTPMYCRLCPKKGGVCGNYYHRPDHSIANRIGGT
jgi:hypothetical protein